MPLNLNKIQDNRDVHFIVTELSRILASSYNILAVCHARDFDYLKPYSIFTDFIFVLIVEAVKHLFNSVFV